MYSIKKKSILNTTELDAIDVQTTQTQMYILTLNSTLT